MKNYIKILGLCSGLFILTSCDKEPNPMYPAEPGDETLIWQYFPGDTALYNDAIVFEENTNTDRNVLIEDYTGHLCNNCPPAAVVAKGIEDANPGRAFVLSVHAGPIGSKFQEAGKVDKFDIDYTTESGDFYATEIPGLSGNPSGMVNRTLPSSSYWLNKDVWGAEVSNLLTANDLKVNIQLQAEFYPSTKGVFVHYEVEAIEDLGSNTRIIILLAEKKIISPQKMEDNSTNETYEHHNVLSGNLSSADFGDVLNENGMLTGDKVQGLVIGGLDELNSRRTVNDDGGNDLIVYGLVVDSDTYEILQVVEQEVEIDKQL